MASLILTRNINSANSISMIDKTANDKSIICLECDTFMAILFNSIEKYKNGILNNNHKFVANRPGSTNTTSNANPNTRTIHDAYIECNRIILSTSCYVKLRGANENIKVRDQDSRIWLKEMLKTFKCLKYDMQYLRNEIVITAYVMIVILIFETDNNIKFKSNYGQILLAALDYIKYDLLVDDNEYANISFDERKNEEIRIEDIETTKSKGKTRIKITSTKDNNVEEDPWYKWYLKIQKRSHIYLQYRQNCSIESLFLSTAEMSQEDLLKGISGFFRTQLHIWNTTHGVIAKRTYAVFTAFATQFKELKNGEECNIRFYDDCGNVL